MSVFADTSCFLALVHQDDPDYAVTSAIWRDIVGSGEDLVTTNYVVLETLALVQRRLGVHAAQGFASVVVPSLDLYWIGEDLHDAAVAALLTANRRDLSLVDCVSFMAMRRLGLSRVLTLDRHFAEQGFTILPEQV